VKSDSRTYEKNTSEPTEENSQELVEPSVDRVKIIRVDYIITIVNLGGIAEVNPFVPYFRDGRVFLFAWLEKTTKRIHPITKKEKICVKNLGGFYLC
jgi:hypothetical protein